jgi:hypothetical protein
VSVFTEGHKGPTGAAWAITGMAQSRLPVTGGVLAWCFVVGMLPWALAASTHTAASRPRQPSTCLRLLQVGADSGCTSGAASTNKDGQQHQQVCPGCRGVPPAAAQPTPLCTHVHRGSLQRRSTVPLGRVGTSVCAGYKASADACLLLRVPCVDGPTEHVMHNRALLPPRGTEKRVHRAPGCRLRAEASGVQHYGNTCTLYKQAVCRSGAPPAQDTDQPNQQCGRHLGTSRTAWGLHQHGAPASSGRGLCGPPSRPCCWLLAAPSSTPYTQPHTDNKRGQAANRFVLSCCRGGVRLTAATLTYRPGLPTCKGQGTNLPSPTTKVTHPPLPHIRSSSRRVAACMLSMPTCPQSPHPTRKRAHSCLQRAPKPGVCIHTTMEEPSCSSTCCSTCPGTPTLHDW